MESVTSRDIKAYIAQLKESPETEAIKKAINFFLANVSDDVFVSIDYYLNIVMWGVPLRDRTDAMRAMITEMAIALFGDGESTVDHIKIMAA